MAELNVTGPDDDTLSDASLAPPATGRAADTDHLLPEHTHAATPGTIAQVDDPDLARMQIEQTRARMSETIDQIEGALLRKKEAIEEKMDVMAPVRRTARENPYPVIGGVFLAGLVLGLLTGGDDDDDEPQPAVRRYAVDFDRERNHGQHWEERSRTWERRARRLMDLANRQEAELLSLRGESVPVRRGGRGRLFGRKAAARGYTPVVEEHVDVEVRMEEGYVRPRRGAYDGMPLHDADSLPPRDEDLGGGYGYRDPLPSPI